MIHICIVDQIFLHQHMFWQVAAPKKTPKPKAEDQSKEVEPQTWTQKAAAALPLLLKEAADARTASIKLHGMEYAKELSGQLLDHAKRLEALYQDMSKAVTNQERVERPCEQDERVGSFWSQSSGAYTGLSYHPSTSQLLTIVDLAFGSESQHEHASAC